MGPMKKKRRIPVFSPHNPAVKTRLFYIGVPVHAYGKTGDWDNELVFRVRARTEKQAVRKATEGLDPRLRKKFPFRKPYVMETSDD